MGPGFWVPRRCPPTPQLRTLHPASRPTATIVSTDSPHVPRRRWFFGQAEGRFMNPRQFDSLTRRLSNRLSRRTAFRLGAGVALGLGAHHRLRPAVAQDAATTVDDRFVSIAVYPHDGDIADARTALKPLVRTMQQQPGFITMSFIDGDEAIYLVMHFLDQTTSEAGRRILDEWIGAIDQEAGIIGPSEWSGGDVFLRSRLGAGCRCNPNDDDPCGSDDLVCCPVAAENRGFCMAAATTCPAIGADDPAPDGEPSATATSIPPTAVTMCTIDGCACVAGVQNACEDGLSCCGADHPGGIGICMATCPCGGEGCACVAGVVNTCDSGLTCCAPGEIGGVGTCQYVCTCTGEGCACTTGVDGACDDGLSCCGIGSQASGSIGVCLTACAADAPCPGAEGCECGAVWKCNDGLICCGATSTDGTGICEVEC